MARGKSCQRATGVRIIALAVAADAQYGLTGEGTPPFPQRKWFVA